MMDIDHAHELDRIALDPQWIYSPESDAILAAARELRRLRSYDFGRADRYAMIVRNLCGLIGITVDCSPHEAAEALKARLASAPDGPPTGVARSIAPGESCQFETCNQPATRVAMGRGYFDATEEDPDKDDGMAIDPDWGDSELRHPGLGVYCEDHAVQVAAEHPNGWHITNCRNCGCRAGH